MITIDCNDQYSLRKYIWLFYNLCVCVYDRLVLDMFRSIDQVCGMSSALHLYVTWKCTLTHYSASTAGYLMRRRVINVIFLFQCNATQILYLQRVGYISHYPVYALHHGGDTVTV